MTVDRWLDDACADADRRGLPELKPLLGALAAATTILRAADWNDDAAGLDPDPDRLDLGTGDQPERGSDAEHRARPASADPKGTAS